MIMLEKLESLKSQLLDAPEEESAPLPEKDSDATPEEPKEDPQEEGSEPKVEESKEPEKHKLVIDGKEVEVTLEDLKKGYNSIQAANKKFQEAANARKEAENLKKQADETILNVEKALSEKPLEFLKNYFAEEYEKIADLIAKERTAFHEKMLNMTPEQKIKYEADKQAEELKREKEQLQKELEDRKLNDTKKEEELYKKELEIEFKNLSEKYPYVEEILPDIKQIIALRVANSEDPDVTIESEYKKEAERLAPYKKEKYSQIRKNESTSKSLNSQKNVSVPEKQPDYMKLSGRARIEAYKKALLG